VVKAGQLSGTCSVQ